MKFLRRIFLAVGSIAVLTNGREIEPDEGQRWWFGNAVADCASFEAAAINGVTNYPGGTLVFLGPIHCRKPVALELYGDTVIESQRPIDTTDLIYIIKYPGVQLVFGAPAVSLKRGEAAKMGDVEILHNARGVVKFEVTAPYPSYDGASAVDKHGLLKGDDGAIASNRQPRYTKYEIVVADPSDAATDEHPGFSGPFKARMPGWQDDPTVHPSPSLKPGDVLRGKLLTENGQAYISASHIDGSILHTRVAGEPPVDENGNQIGPIPLTVTTLIESDPKKVIKVYQLRADIDQEELQAVKATREGKPVKKGVKQTVLSIFPWGKAGWLHQRAMACAKAHRGEVEVRISNRGFIESFMDGRKVLSKGPSSE